MKQVNVSKAIGEKTLMYTTTFAILIHATYPLRRFHVEWFSRNYINTIFLSPIYEAFT